MQDKAHCDRLEDELNDENPSRDDVAGLAESVERCLLVLWVDSLLVILHCKRHRVEDDCEKDEVVEPAPLDEPNNGLSQPHILVENEVAASIIVLVLPMHVKDAIELPQRLLLLELAQA